MPDQVPVSVPTRDQTDDIRELLRPGGLFSLEPRRVLLYAARFPRLEADLRDARSHQGAQAMRIAVLASLSVQHFVAVLRLFLYSDGVLPDFHIAGFDAIAGEGSDAEATFWQTPVDALLLLPATTDIKTWPPLFAGAEEVRTWVGACAQPYLDIWQRAASRLPGCRIYHGLFVPPLERPLGNLERRYPFSRTNCLAALNAFLLENAPANVSLIDLDSLSGLVGRQHWVDEAAYFTSKQPFGLRSMPLVASQLSRMMVAGRGTVRKCLVLDLDNTLWGGVVGDDGVEGIRLDPSDPVGEAFLAFQRYVLALKERGVLLAVCSKNNPDLARSVFETHPDMLLAFADFAAFLANWDDKASNLRRIAEQLNIGMDALVFFDDNPAERSLVRQFAPTVLVIEVPEDPALFVRTLDMSFAFEWAELTSEDLGRSASYADDRKRLELVGSFDDYDAYLRSLDMHALIEATGQAALGRVCQLCNKTNQFNLRNQRYSEGELQHLIESPDHAVFHVRLRDRFTNYGIIGSVVLRLVGRLAFVENWAMSCRVFKRGVEEATFNAIVAAATAREAEWLAAEYVETAKNGYVANLLERLGLIPWDQAPDLPRLPEDAGAGVPYIGKVSETLLRPHFISVDEFVSQAASAGSGRQPTDGCR